MTNVALFDVVIPAVIGWVLVDDLMRSMRNPARVKAVITNVVTLKPGGWKTRQRVSAAGDLSVTQRLPVIEAKKETCGAC